MGNQDETLAELKKISSYLASIRGTINFFGVVICLVLAVVFCALTR